MLRPALHQHQENENHSYWTFGNTHIRPHSIDYSTFVVTLFSLLASDLARPDRQLFDAVWK